MHHLTLDDVALQPDDDFSTYGLGDSHDFGDGFFGDIEGVNEQTVGLIEFAGVIAEQFGELSYARIKHEVDLIYRFNNKIGSQLGADCCFSLVFLQTKGLQACLRPLEHFLQPYLQFQRLMGHRS